jgi:hypothetical protein
MAAPLTSVIYYPGYSQTQVQYIPLNKQIAAITQTNPMVVTTTTNHGYRAGQNVAYLIPQIYGMSQLNSITSNIISVTDTTFTTDTDSTSFYPFVIPGSFPSAYSSPYVIPNAEGIDVSPPLPYGNQAPFFGVVENAENPLTGGG